MRSASWHTQAFQAALLRLDRRLKRAVEIARTVYGQAASSDPFRGLYISDSDVQRLFARKPGEPALWSGIESDRDPLPAEHPTNHLKRQWGLSDFEMDVLFLSVSVEVDLRYERIYAWLQDDATRRRPTVALALDLLCRSFDDRLMRRAAFNPDAALLQTGLLHWGADPGPHAPLLTRTLVPDEAVVRFLLGHEALDRRLEQWCRWITPGLRIEDVPVSAEVQRSLKAVAARPAGNCLFHGPRGCGQRQAAEALAEDLGLSLLTADLTRLNAQEDQAPLRALALEACLQEALIYLTGMDEWAATGQTGALLAGVEQVLGAPAPVVIDSASDMIPALAAGRRLHPIAFTPPTRDHCRIWWSSRLGCDPRLEGTAAQILSSRYRLNLDQIDTAAALASSSAGVDSAGMPTSASIADLSAAARRVSGQELARLADPIEPVRRWADIVLPEPTLAQLQELCERVGARHRVLDDWGFASRLSTGTGCNALFTGAPGTGKTLAAEIIAAELGLNLYRIDLSSVVSKYIGETEKNLSRIFTAAEQSNAILLFDEADALFGKRSAVRDAHDRYANIEVSFLLQRMEQYDGLAILATNLAQNLDDAFVRRLAFTIQFPFPSATLRERIWADMWPVRTPLGEDIDHAWLARGFKLSGGHIRNAALAAAYLAAADGGVVTLAHIRQALRREFQKMGKALSDAELGMDGAALPEEAVR